MSSTTIIAILIIIVLCFILYKSLNLLLKVGFVLLITGYLYYQYGQGLL
ncbi:MAG: hypothetical protein U0M80_04770 [Fusobacterium mortiferum]|nr:MULTISPECIES: hypothetical protein [Fusobacterium]MCF2627545.1 hypothetical protein [Fusobacterium mortiferum]MCI6381991.1 hypothetical protein [Fusobacterium mortiferum]MDD7262204.1 hypothetical protein [Fusobacterium mortiferum]MDY2801306.1 hypothetical protein [Fusobacterium mortiferum]MDY5981313.1 hypothetical protein [Fusobacterium mortiferum]